MERDMAKFKFLEESPYFLDVQIYDWGNSFLFQKGNTNGRITIPKLQSDKSNFGIEFYDDECDDDDESVEEYDGVFPEWFCELYKKAEYLVLHEPAELAKEKGGFLC